MLAGVGGKTIAEAKANLSYDEALKWFDYMRRKGKLDLATRLEVGFALLATVISNVNGGKAKMADFMMFEKEAGSGKPESISIESALAMLGGTAKDVDNG